MAYLDLHQGFAGARPVAAPADAALFGQAEWQVIMLAEKEGLSSLTEPGPIARAFRRLIGAPTIRRLANPRLEALRRFAVLAWHHSYALPASAITALRGAGFSEAQLDYALASIAGARSRSPRRAA